MGRLRFAVVAAALSFGLSGAAPSRILTMDGLGPVKLGMSVQAAERALGAKFKLEYPDANPSDECAYARRLDGRDSYVG
jgi:hypothetical protein